MRYIRRFFTLLLTVLYCMTVSAGAQSYTPSPTPGRPVVVDPEGISDILVVTPYEYRNEILQQYKIDQFETADAALTQDAIYRAVESYMTEDMTREYLVTAAHWYVHEKNDSGIIELPVTITVSTELDFGDGYEEVSLARAAASSQGNEFLHLLQYDNGVWVRIPASFHADGSITFTVNAFGPYAIITYEVQENPPHHPDRPDRPHHSGGSGTPHSPQTGEKDPFALLPPVLAAAALSVLIAKKMKVSRK